jgi:hypothetical protein
MQKSLFFLFLFSSTFFLSRAQVGGENTYDFLKLTSSARIAALGGEQIAVKDNDPFLGFNNPSLLNEEMDQKVALTYQAYLADIGQGFASYTTHIDSLGTFSAGIKYIDYGKFTERDNIGNDVGEFTAGEYAFVIGYGRELDSNYSIGANIKTIYSSFYDYTSVGLALDLGATYTSSKTGLTLALLAKNIGSQLSSYTDEKEALPFEVQMGLTKRFKRVPLRVGLVAHQLQQWDLTYENPALISNSDLLGEGEDNQNKDGFFENLGRHLILNAEFLVTENFNIRFGYNYLRRAELKIDEKLGSVGISWGFGMRISKFHLSYGRAAYHQAGATNTFSVSTRLSDFIN